MVRVCEGSGANECPGKSTTRNPQRQSAIREFKARVRDETPKSPSRWLPSPPVTVSPVKRSGEEMRVGALRLYAGYGYKITTRDMVIVNHLFILFTQ